MKTWIALFCFALLAVSPPSHAQDSDSLTWARANSCERIRDYIARYPSGRYLAQARAQLTARNCPAPQASAPADPCVRARADWAEIAQSSDLSVLQAYQQSAPAECTVQRAQVDARIRALQPTTARPARPPRATDAARDPAAGLTHLQEFDDCDGAAWCPRMIVLAGGTYTQGRRGEYNAAPREVTVGRFAVGKFEVRSDQWSACLAAGACPTIANVSQSNGAIPVSTNWNGAQAYVRWLSQRTGRRYRLLSEAEWEYAARGGTTTRWYWGDERDAVCTYENLANRDNNPLRTDTRSYPPCDDGAGGVTAVGRYRPNPFGLHDVFGNVGEHVQDCVPSPDNRDFLGPATSAAYVFQGCTVRRVRGLDYFTAMGQSLLITFRSGSDADFTLNGAATRLTGVRVARDVR